MKLEKVQSVYVMYNPEINITKIGISEDVNIRCQSLRSAVGCDIQVKYHTEPITNALIIESKAHEHFNDCRRLGEWFNLSPDQAIKYIKSLNYLFNVDPIIKEYIKGLPVSTIAAQFKVSRQAI